MNVKSPSRVAPPSALPRITFNHLRPSPFPPRVTRAPPRDAAQRPSPLSPAPRLYSAATTQQRAHGVD
eukprot:4111931-Pleurochrysis_carterae.AAC.1